MLDGRGVYGGSAVIMESLLDEVVDITSVCDDAIPFQPAIQVEIDGQYEQRSTVVDRGKQRAKLIECDEPEVAFDSDHNDDARIVNHAYSKVGNIPSGTYSKDLLGHKSDPAVMKPFSRDFSLGKMSTVRLIDSYNRNANVTRRPYG
jgi:hypothetical protein